MLYNGVQKVRGLVVGRKNFEDGSGGGLIVQEQHLHVAYQRVSVFVLLGWH